MTGDIINYFNINALQFIKEKKIFLFLSGMFYTHAWNGIQKSKKENFITASFVINRISYFMYSCFFLLEIEILTI